MKIDTTAEAIVKEFKSLTVLTAPDFLDAIQDEELRNYIPAMVMTMGWSKGVKTPDNTICDAVFYLQELSEKKREHELGKLEQWIARFIKDPPKKAHI